VAQKKENAMNVRQAKEGARRYTKRAKNYAQDVAEGVRDYAAGALNEGKEISQKLAADLDKRAHKNPWPLVAGAAVVALLTGFSMGRKINCH